MVARGQTRQLLRRRPEKCLNKSNQRKCGQEIQLLRSLCFDTIRICNWTLWTQHVLAHRGRNFWHARDARNISASLKESSTYLIHPRWQERCRTWCVSRAVPLHIWKHWYTCSEDILRLISYFGDILVWIPLMYNVSHVISESKKKASL